MHALILCKDAQKNIRTVGVENIEQKDNNSYLRIKGVMSMVMTESSSGFAGPEEC